MKPRHLETLRITAVGVLFSLAGTAGSTVTRASVRCTPQKFLCPAVTAQALDGGQMETEPERGRYALQIEVNPADPARGWVLYLKAEHSTFSPPGAGKPCADLKWKLDQEDREAYRPLDEHGTVVLENASGGSARITLDLRIALDWRTDPGTYDLGMVFTIVYL